MKTNLDKAREKIVKELMKIKKGEMKKLNKLTKDLEETGVFFASRKFEKEREVFIRAFEVASGLYGKRKT